MKPSLDGPRLKLERADEHLDALHRELRVFADSHADRPTLDYAFDGTWHIVVAGPLSDEPPPPHISLICGDAVHNMRCALDHMIWQLVLREGNRPNQFNAFPIYVRRVDFDTRVRRPSRPERSPLQGIEKAPCKASK